jgi:nucleotide-binding universal stress UspA family protein
MITEEAAATVTAVKTSITLTNVLCATDFSEVSKKALLYASAIAHGHRARLSIVHVLPADARMPIPVEPLPSNLDREWLEAKSNLQIIEDESFLAGVDHEVILERGAILEVISDLIRSKKIDLLVLGTHGRSGMNKFLLGSVAEELFRISSCPVLTVGTQAPSAAENGPQIHTILFPTDFSSVSLAALPYALSISKADTRQLILLHVVTPRDAPAQHLNGVITISEKRQLEALDVTRQMEALVPDDVKKSCNVQYLISFGAAPKRISEAVDRYRPDLVVMGIKKYSAPRAAAHVHWSIAHHLVCRARCPVLTIRL